MKTTKFLFTAILFIAASSIAWGQYPIEHFIAPSTQDATDANFNWDASSNESLMIGHSITSGQKIWVQDPTGTASIRIHGITNSTSKSQLWMTSADASSAVDDGDG